MTTRLNKPVSRIGYAPSWGDLVLTLAPEGLILREKGKRTKYGPLPWGKLMMMGAKMKAEETMQARKAKRKGKR